MLQACTAPATVFWTPRKPHPYCFGPHSAPPRQRLEASLCFNAPTGRAAGNAARRHSGQLTRMAALEDVPIEASEPDGRLVSIADVHAERFLALLGKHGEAAVRVSQSRRVSIERGWLDADSAHSFVFVLGRLERARPY
jgi:hypothetical protein